VAAVILRAQIVVGKLIDNALFCHDRCVTIVISSGACNVAADRVDYSVGSTDFSTYRLETMPKGMIRPQPTWNEIRLSQPLT
jgi:hypothetical protein